MPIGHRHSEATIAKMRERYFSPEHREKIKESKLGLIIPEEQRIRQSMTAVIDPWGVVNRETGESFYGYNLKGFCRENELGYKGMHRMATGGRNHYKGWTIGHPSNDNKP